MTLFSDIRKMAERLQTPLDEANTSSYQDARFDISDQLLDLLDKYPQDTGHEWKAQIVQWEENGPTEVREICGLCGLDRILGDEGEKCDNARPMEKPATVEG